MTKRLIEVDDEKLDAVRELLGTHTLKATVDAAWMRSSPSTVDAVRCWPSAG
jgi:Arc/MetJ family transcription regulator